MGTISPLKDYIDAAWEKTTKEFLRWYPVVVPLQANMDSEGKEYPLQEKSRTYRRISMGHHEEFYFSLPLLSVTEEGKRRKKQQCLVLSEQVKELSRVVEDLDKDLMVTGVDYLESLATRAFTFPS